MNELEKQNLKKYLEDVKNVESTIFTQATLLNTLDYQLNNLELEEKQINEPYKKTFNDILGSKKELFFNKLLFAEYMIMIILPTAVLILFLLFVFLNDFFSYIISIFAVVLFLIILIDSIISGVRSYFVYLKKKKEYKQVIKKYEDNYNYYLEEIEAEKQRLASEELKKQYLELQYDELYSTYSNSLETVKKMYNLNYIFPKYRNFGAITQIAEYFLSGRCDRLDGPDGAYNLYESELKMNRIVDKLNDIVNNLETISRNQFMLYEEICQSNQIAEQLLNSINSACDRLSDIKVNTAVTAYNTDVIQSNTAMARYY